MRYYLLLLLSFYTQAETLSLRQLPTFIPVFCIDNHVSMEYNQFLVPLVVNNEHIRCDVYKELYSTKKYSLPLLNVDDGTVKLPGDKRNHEVE